MSLYNDFGDVQTVDMVAALALEMTEGCPNGCNGHGECVLGRCQCESGYGGEDCSQGNPYDFERFLRPNLNTENLTYLTKFTRETGKHSRDALFCFGCLRSSFSIEFHDSFSTHKKSLF